MNVRILKSTKLIRKYATIDNEIPDLTPIFEYILNVNTNQSHGFSPHEILFGEKPPFNLSQELLHSDEPVPVQSDYVTWLKNKLKLIQSDVDRNVHEARLQQKRTYDKKFKTSYPSFKEGDQCWLEKMRAKPNSQALASHKYFDGPFYISKVVSRQQTLDETSPDVYPTLENCAMGVAYQLTDSRTGKILKSLINSRRLKPYVSSESFEMKYPPLTPRKPQVQQEMKAPSGLASNKPNSSAAQTELPNQWFAAKNIIRQRKKDDQLEFLIRFADNSCQWISSSDVSDELKRRYFLKRAATRKRQQKKARDAFRLD